MQRINRKRKVKKSDSVADRPPEGAGPRLKCPRLDRTLGLAGTPAGIPSQHDSSRRPETTSAALEAQQPGFSSGPPAGPQCPSPEPAKPRKRVLRAGGGKQKGLGMKENPKAGKQGRSMLAGQSRLQEEEDIAAPGRQKPHAEPCERGNAGIRHSQLPSPAGPAAAPSMPISSARDTTLTERRHWSELNHAALPPGVLYELQCRRLHLFLEGCMAAEVINGLASLATHGLLPVQMEGSTCPLRDTLAAMMVLASRARLPEGVLAGRPEALLAVLWILEGYSMQVRGHLKVVLHGYLDYATVPPKRWRTTQAWGADLREWQRIIAINSDWRLYLQWNKDLPPVLDMLGAARFGPQIAALDAALSNDIAFRSARPEMPLRMESCCEAVRPAVPFYAPPVYPWQIGVRRQEASSAAQAATGDQLTKLERALEAAHAAPPLPVHDMAVMSRMAAQWWGPQQAPPPPQVPPPEATVHAPPDAQTAAEASAEASFGMRLRKESCCEDESMAAAVASRCPPVYPRRSGDRPQEASSAAQAATVDQLKKLDRTLEAASRALADAEAKAAPATPVVKHMAIMSRMSAQWWWAQQAPPPQQVPPPEATAHAPPDAHIVAEASFGMRLRQESSCEDESMAAAVASRRPPMYPSQSGDWPQELSNAAQTATGDQLKKLDRALEAASRALANAEAKAAPLATVAPGTQVMSRMSARWWGPQQAPPPQQVPPPEATAHAPRDAHTDAEASAEASLGAACSIPAAGPASRRSRPQVAASSVASQAGASGSRHLYGQQMPSPAAGSGLPARMGRRRRVIDGTTQEEPNEVEMALLQRIAGRRVAVRPLRSSVLQQQMETGQGSAEAAIGAAAPAHAHSQELKRKTSTKSGRHMQSEAIGMDVDSVGGEEAQHPRHSIAQARELLRLSAAHASGLDGAYWACKRARSNS